MIHQQASIPHNSASAVHWSPEGFDSSFVLPRHIATFLGVASGRTSPGIATLPLGQAIESDPPPLLFSAQSAQSEGYSTPPQDLKLDCAFAYRGLRQRKTRVRGKNRPRGGSQSRDCWTMEIERGNESRDNGRKGRGKGRRQRAQGKGSNAHGARRLHKARRKALRRAWRKEIGGMVPPFGALIAE